MKKFLILVLLIILAIGGWYGANYVYIENHFESVFYPNNGMVQTEKDAVDLCCFYFKSVYGIEVLPNQLNAIYYKSKNAWYIKTVKKENEKNFVDGGLSILIRKKDGKVMMHSIY